VITHKARRTIAGTALVMLLAAATVLTGAAPAAASWHQAHVGNSGVNVRDCFHPQWHVPSTSCTFQAYLAPGTSVHVVCQYFPGQNINGDAVWDYIVYAGGEGYASDWYINTHQESYWIPGIDRCEGSL